MTTFIEINNQGIKHIEAREYGKAAKLFKEALDTLKQTMAPDTTTQQQQQRQQQSTSTTEQGVETSTHVCESRDCETGKQKKETRTKKRKEQSTNKKEDRQQPENCNDETRRKRQRRMTDTTITTTTATEATKDTVAQEPPVPSTGLERKDGVYSLLCRPLRLEPTRRVEQTTTLSLTVQNVYAASILYNFAYSLQQATTKIELPEQHKRKMMLFEKAMETYGKAIRVSLKARCCPMVLWMCCHNMQQLLLELRRESDRESSSPDDDDEEFARKYCALENQKTAILQSTASTMTGNRMCLLVISMLGVGGNERSLRPAAAA